MSAGPEQALVSHSTLHAKPAIDLGREDLLQRIHPPLPMPTGFQPSIQDKETEQ
jgi:hypothetical protein